MPSVVDAPLPRVRWSNRRIVATILMAAVGGFLAYDLVWVEPRNDARAELDASAGHPITAVLILRNVRHDRSARAVLADVRLEVRSVADRQLTSLIFSPRTTRAGLRSWLRVPSGRCDRLQATDHANQDVPYRSSAHTTCKDVEVSDEVMSGEIWYPFDRHSTLLNPRVCIGTTDPVACNGGQAPRATTIRIDAEPGAMDVAAGFSSVTQHSGIVVLQRRLFLRAVSVVCLAMSLIFVTYLVRVGDPKETMTQSLGIFAALWGFRELVVPESVVAFPTIVDFTILTIFCVVFALVLLRAGEPKVVHHRKGAVPE